MTMTLRILQIASAQFDSALSLLQRFFIEEGFDAPPEQIRANLTEFFAHNDYSVFLAYLNDQPVGIATVSTSISVELGRMAEIDDLYVLPEARGQGVAKALITKVIEWCQSQGRAYIQVAITPAGEAAHGLQKFYKQLGFIDTQRALFAHLTTNP